MKIAIGCDHAGFVLKGAVLDFLRSRDIDVLDLGAYEYDKDDSYADPAFRVGGAIADETVDLGILMCGTGYGISIAANKVPGVRAVACWSAESARIAKARHQCSGTWRKRDQARRSSGNHICMARHGF